jgi:hypothetical protein
MATKKSTKKSAKAKTAPKVSVKLAYTTTTDLFRVRLAGKLVSFSGGKADVPVDAGKSYPLQWFAEGSPGSRYTVEVTAPKSAAFKHTATLDGDGADAGIEWLAV